MELKKKICPICKEEKNISEFPSYFSKQRNKIRIGNYCKPCGRKSSTIIAKQHYQDNKAQKLQYAKDYRANPDNKEKLLNLSRSFKKKYIEELQDCYVRELLATRNGIPTEVSKEIPEIVEIKRLQIKIKRKIKTLKNGKK